MPDIGWSEWLSMMTSLAVVLVLLAVTLFALKKMGASTTKNAGKSLQISEVHNLAPRQKLIVVTINDEQILLGVTPQSINRLGNWPNPAVEAANAAPLPLQGPEETEPDQGDTLPSASQGGKFKRLLKQLHDRASDPASDQKKS
jgi:flagellar biosynthetic protein FliO